MESYLIALAAGLKASKPIDAEGDLVLGNRRFQWDNDVRIVADVCAGANPRFNRALFLKACGA